MKSITANLLLLLSCFALYFSILQKNNELFLVIILYRIDVSSLSYYQILLDEIQQDITEKQKLFCEINIHFVSLPYLKYYKL
ncbi:hypothetical protein [Prevotella sp. HUN102]|uniref:hypothetical protein n=1 Tax=Prevotella sp. HUN102 TaxID=1392486 RepID=UPI000491E468|nr:hypothetical protein [Prevotella sp. HUN102]